MLVVDNDGTEAFLVAFPLPVVLNTATLSSQMQWNANSVDL
jgi:hypothetical protein